MNRIQMLLQNRHTTGAALVAAFCQLATIWFPDYKEQLDATQNWAMVYAMLLAGDSKPISGSSDETKIILPPAPNSGTDTR